MILELKRGEWALSPRPEVQALTMEARLSLDVSGPQCDVVDPLIHALMKDGAQWTRIEVFEHSPSLSLSLAGAVLE